MPIRFQVDPDFYDHPKTLGLSDAATALWVRAGSYSAAKLTDGFIAEHVLALLSTSPAEAADELRRRGLWLRVKGGFRFHQWDHRNLKKERVEADREYDRNRKRQERQAARQNGKPQVNTQSVRAESERSPGGVQTESERSPYRSVSVSVSESVSGSGRGSAPRASPAGEPPRQCLKHLDNPDPPPCGHCADQRRTHARWEAAEAQRKRDAPKCRKHRGMPADNCGLCRAEQIAGD